MRITSHLLKLACWMAVLMPCGSAARSQAGWLIPQASTDSSTLFINGWRAAIQTSYVIAWKDSARFYLFYPVSTVDSVKPDLSSVRRYFWKTYISRMFVSAETKVLQAAQANLFSFAKGVVRGVGNDSLYYICTDTIVENPGVKNATAAFVVYVRPYRGQKPTVLPADYLRNAYRYFNRFLVKPADLTGNWREVWYTDKYNPDTMQPLRTRQTVFSFRSDGTYDNVQTVRTGILPDTGRVVAIRYAYAGNFSLSGIHLTLDHRAPATGAFDCWMTATAGGRKVLCLINRTGEQYTLIK